MSFPPIVLRFLDWLKKTDGRDKLCRLVAYGSKIPIHLLKSIDGDKDTIDRLQKGASAVGTGRKFMRLFRALQFLQDLLQSLGTGDLIERAISSIKSASLTIWMLVDHHQWMAKAGYLRPSKELQERLSKLHSQAWAVGLFLGVLGSTYKLLKLSNESRTDKIASDLKVKRNKAVQGLAKNGIDLFIPLARLGILSLNDGLVGLAGTVTSVIGIVDTFPK